MECFICINKAEARESGGDYAEVSCLECGEYRVSGTVLRLLEKGRWLHTVGMQQWLEEQRRNGATAPMINSDVVIWEGVWGQA